MSDEIKQEPVDNQPAKELSTDELGKVTGGCFGSILVSAAVVSVASPPPEPPEPPNPVAELFQHYVNPR
jgi:hypothetical protein